MYRPLLCLLLVLPALQAVSHSQLPDYPGYRGPGAGAPADTGVELVRSFDEARVLWQSEEMLPADDPNPYRDGDCGAYSFGSPVVADGKVIITYWLPTGPFVTIAPNKWAKAGTKVQIDAHEIVVCMDALTGKTIWRTVYENTGYNFPALYPSDGQITPRVADGRVYFLGGMGRLYCLDAKTGAKHWDRLTCGKALEFTLLKEEELAGRRQPAKLKREIFKHLQRDIPDYDSRIERLRQLEEEGPQQGSGGGMFNSTPEVYNGKVVIANASGVAVAFDAHTGKKLWSQGGMPTTTCPLKWTHQGRDYFIHYPKGECIEPATGKVLWTCDIPMQRSRETPAILGDHMVCTFIQDPESRRPPPFVGCIQLGPQGTKLLWRLPAHTANGLESPVIHRGHAFLMVNASHWTKWSEEERQALLPAKYAGPSIKQEGKSLHFAEEAPELDSGRLILSVAMESGQVVGMNFGHTINSHGAMPFAMNGRLFIGCRAMYSTTPDDRGILPLLDAFTNGVGDTNVPLVRQRPTRCNTVSGSGGLLFSRVDQGPHLVRCWDLRQR